MTKIAVPGDQTRYPARYAVRELADVQASHNPHSFEPNPAYEYTNDRDYSRRSKDFSWVQDPQGIHHSLECAHQVDLGRAAGLGEPGFLEQTDPVLGADTSLVSAD